MFKLLYGNGHWFFYSLSCKTVNTRENLWNVYCFVTNQVQDENAKDNRQTMVWISHNLTQNNELAFPSTITFPLFNMNLCNLDMPDWHGLRTVQNINAAKNITKNLTQVINNWIWFHVVVHLKLNTLDHQWHQNVVIRIKKSSTQGDSQVCYWCS